MQVFGSLYKNPKVGFWFLRNLIFSIFLLDSNGGYSLMYIYVLKLIESKINEDINFDDDAFDDVNKYLMMFKRCRWKKEKKEKEELGA